MLLNTWVKSSHSESGNCVEVLAWIKSSYSGSNQNCVEVAGDGTRVLVRDSKDPGGPALIFTPDEWTAFLSAVHGGEFDHLAQAGRQPVR